MLNSSITVEFAALAAGWQLLIDNLESDTCECPLEDMGVAGRELGVMKIGFVGVVLMRGLLRIGVALTVDLYELKSLIMAQIERWRQA